MLAIPDDIPDLIQAIPKHTVMPHIVNPQIPSRIKNRQKAVKSSHFIGFSPCIVSEFISLVRAIDDLCSYSRDRNLLTI